VIVTIRGVSEELKENNQPKCIEWDAVGGDGKEIKPKIYPAIQVNEQWIHFEDRWDEFRNARDKTYDIERANIKVEKGYWMPVIKATKVENIFVKEAMERVGDNRESSIEAQVAFKGAIELLANKMSFDETTDARLRNLHYTIVESALRWGIGKLDPAVEIISVVKGAKVEPTKETKGQDKSEDRPDSREGTREIGEIKRRGKLWV